jgi:GNAT superfamily N-acetyltransferase
MNQSLIRPASRDDLAAIGTIGPSAYAESYNYAWADAAGYAAYLHTFSREALERLPADTFFWVAEVDGWVVGFLQLKHDSPDPLRQRPRGTEIQRLYLLKPCRGTGLGAGLLAAAQDAARSRGAEYLWLLTMRSATWARHTYERWGFTIAGELRYPGLALAREQELYLMCKQTPSEATSVETSSD